MKNLVFSIGVNDANYPVQKFETAGYKGAGKQIKKLIWTCPFYGKWKHMLERCYSKKFHSKRPSYKGCSVFPEWHYFMTFRAWMEKQDWEDKHLDKDLLFPGNKVYSADTCVFIDPKVNGFLTESTASRGEWSIGVYLDKNSGKFKAQCRDVILGKQKHLGLFENPNEAHEVWLAFKLEQAKLLAAEQTDPRVAEALINRYDNYTR